MGLFDPQRSQNQGQRPSSNLGGRLLVAAIIAAMALFSYMSQVEVNPVTGVKQHVAISPDQEIRLGIESVDQMSEDMGGEVAANDPRAQEVDSIGAYLVNHTVAKNSPWQFKFHLLKDPETVNAFALPGGQIFITLGLLNELENEAQLAGVLGHEMGHVIERHTAEQMALSQLGKMLVVAVGSAAASSDPNSYNPVAIAAFVNQIIQLRYSRQDESEADTWGLRLMQEAGFDPYAMIEVMKVLKKAGGGAKGQEIFQTHPNPELRMEQIQAYLEKNPPPPGLSQGRALKEVLGNIKPAQEEVKPQDLLNWLLKQGQN
jgi:predicted Zn-dependent protease